MAHLLEISQLVTGRKDAIIQSFDSQLDGGNLVIISGKNGTGKSTLLKTLAGIIPSYSGKVSVNGNIVKYGAHALLSKQIAYVNTERVNEDYIRVEELIRFGQFPYLKKGFEKDDNELFDSAVELMNIRDILKKYLNTISDGEWQKANIARAIVQNTPVILMDEPGAFLDYPSKIHLYSDLRKIASDKNKLILITTHDIELANRFGHLFWHIENGILSISEKPFEWNIDLGF